MNGFALPIVPIMVDLRVMVGSTLTSIWESQCMLEVISGVTGAIVVDMYNKKRWEWYVNVYQKKKKKEHKGGRKTWFLFMLIHQLHFSTTRH